MARSSGERGWRNARAVAVSRAARLSGPTAVASNSAAPSTANEPDQTGSPGPRTTGSDSPVRLASSSASPSAAHHRPVGDHLVAGRQPHEIADHHLVDRHAGGRRPSRTTTASGATSAASRSSARLERISWNDPIAMFATRIPRKSASFHDPNAIVSTPKTSRIPFGIVSVLARTMLA